MTEQYLRRFSQAAMVMVALAAVLSAVPAVGQQLIDEALATAYERLKADPNLQDEQTHLDWWIKEDSARYVTDAKKSIILNYTQGNGSQHLVKLIFNHRGCQVFLQLSSKPGTNSDCTEAMALDFGRRLCRNIDRHFGGKPQEGRFLIERQPMGQQ